MSAINDILSNLKIEVLKVGTSATVSESMYFRRGVDTAHDLLLQDFLAAQAELEGNKDVTLLSKYYQRVVLGAARILAYLEATTIPTSNTSTTTVEAIIPVSNVDTSNTTTTVGANVVGSTPVPLQ